MNFHVISSVFKRNFTGYLSNPTGYVFIAGVALLLCLLCISGCSPNMWRKADTSEQHLLNIKNLRDSRVPMILLYADYLYVYGPGPLRGSYLYMAVWDDGTVICRKPKGDNSLFRGQGEKIEYLSAQLSRESIDSLFSLVDTEDMWKHSLFYLTYVDLPHVCMFLKGQDRYLYISMPELSFELHFEKEREVYEKWNKIISKLSSMCPASGKSADVHFERVNLDDVNDLDIPVLIR